MGSSLAELLRAWREAERRWELPGSPEQIRAAALRVVGAWATYQNASLPDDTDEFMLVADDNGTYIAATNGVRGVLGYEPGSLVGQRIVDITAPAILDQTQAEWERFLAGVVRKGPTNFATPRAAWSRFAIKHGPTIRSRIPRFPLVALRSGDAEVAITGGLTIRAYQGTA